MTSLPESQRLRACLDGVHDLDDATNRIANLHLIAREAIAALVEAERDAEQARHELDQAKWDADRARDDEVQADAEVLRLRARAESAEAELRGHIGCVGHRRFASVVASLNRAREKSDHFMRLAGRAEEERDGYEAALLDIVSGAGHFTDRELVEMARRALRGEA